MARNNARENIALPKERIDSSTGNLMVITALGFDFFQGIIGMLPIVGPMIAGFIINPIVFLTFFVWLKLHGVSIGDSVQRLALMFGGFLIELIPLLNILPAWTLTIFMTVLIVQRSDKRKIKEFYINNKTQQQ